MSLVPAYTNAIDESAIAAQGYKDEAAQGIILNDDGEVLLLERDDKPEISHPGLWTTPGGRMNPGETPEETFLREMGEEVNYHPSGYYYFTRTIDPGGYHDLNHIFADHARVALRDLRRGEGKNMGFFSYEQIKKMKVVPFVQGYLKVFFEQGFAHNLVAELKNEKR